MDENELARTAKARGGLQTVEQGRRALTAVLGALRCALDEQDVRSLADALPARTSRTLRREPTGAVRDSEHLFAEAARRERVSLGFAREHTQVVLELLAGELDPELIARLRRRLPASIAALLRPPSRRAAGAPPHVRVHAARAPSPAQTLSRARPGSSDAIAEARHELAHAGSVARSAAPHAERMVETARSTRPGREDETLATTRGGRRRRK
jgi:uncharacterized protein (DUF2267 family)